ncbi:NADH dehydrogenase subunit 4 (mitochondrion) [Phyllobates terribilis]|uniref:NADH-ubiquinone oxidoreductase chain 4 n=1 Tax=Phyllobates terribilis TaxID=111132 RepID=A0A343J6E9_PHYTE|nr:NADH dehydrogenase subunit 4 [Phyllobates terribilis]ASV64520.1 NADH dehydrogenase subunit 4 [Phyllobates terribilis]
MLTILTPLMLMLFIPWITPAKRLWETSSATALIVAALSTSWFLFHKIFFLTNLYFLVDEISSPLLILTYWLTAPTLLASQSKLSNEPIVRQRLYIFTIIVLQVTTLLAFMVNSLILFFIMFETTMIPTLIIITRWGAQKERMLAGTYLLFYTLFGSMALLTVLLLFYENIGTLSIFLLKNTMMSSAPHLAPLWWSACFLAFLVKMPLYGLHLWLPKAHVEAPIAGSMILAGTLLKLGGYGILRMTTMMDNSLLPLAAPLIIFSLFGVLLSAILCSRQTDLKSLIAFSSVSHMGLVIAASMIKTNWSITGAMVLMISHGLVSSALFCLANTSYERTNSRTLVLLQGSQIIFPLTAAWWLTAALLNMALPPSLNFIGELSILSSLFQWSSMTLIIAGLSIIFTTSYSLYLFWASQREHLPPHTKLLTPSQTREHIILLLHIMPVLFVTLKPNLMF